MIPKKCERSSISIGIGPVTSPTLGEQENGSV